MIEINNNRVKCSITSGASPPMDEEQERLYQDVIEAVHIAHELFELYKNRYGTDKRGVNRILTMLNGGPV